MSVATIIEQIEELNPDEKADLVYQVWNQLVDSDWQPPLSESHAEVIDRRLQALDANPQATLTWDEIVAHVRRER